MPDADNADAWIVTVTETKHIYFGVDLVTPQGYGRRNESSPAQTAARRLYVKADARAPFATVAQVLNAARADSFDRAILLTATAGLCRTARYDSLAERIAHLA